MDVLVVPLAIVTFRYGQLAQASDHNPVDDQLSWHELELIEAENDDPFEKQ